jgi:hypothetical protein
VKLSEIVEEIREAAEHIFSMAAKFGTRYFTDAYTIWSWQCLLSAHAEIVQSPSCPYFQLSNYCLFILDIFKSNLFMIVFPCFSVVGVLVIMYSE